MATGDPDADGDWINIEVTEVNGVWVILTSADIKVRQHNRFSKPISLFLWKVPSSTEHRLSISLDPVRLCGDWTNIQIPMDTISKSIIDYLLGADFETIVTLNGYDEIGRTVRVKIEIWIISNNHIK